MSCVAYYPTFVALVPPPPPFSLCDTAPTYRQILFRPNQQKTLEINVLYIHYLRYIIFNDQPVLLSGYILHLFEDRHHFN